jgi:MFS family permease
MAIITDLFSLQQRGRVMGFVQMAFSASQILGIPIGLFLADKFSWHATFFMVVILALEGEFSYGLHALASALVAAEAKAWAPLAKLGGHFFSGDNFSLGHSSHTLHLKKSSLSFWIKSSSCPT